MVSPASSPAPALNFDLADMAAPKSPHQSGEFQRRDSNASLNFSEVDDQDFEVLDLDDQEHSHRPRDRLDEVNLLRNPVVNQLAEVADNSNKSNLNMAFMNMANSIIGAGVIGQAYAVKQAGLVGGTFLLIILTFIIDWTIRLMVTNSKLSGMRTYQSTVKHCFGRTGEVIVSVAQLAFAFGGSIAYCVIIGDTLPHVMKALLPDSWQSNAFVHFMTGRTFFIVFCTAFISYPLSLNRHIGALAKASALALVSMIVIILTVVVRGPAVTPPDAKMTLPLWTVNVGFFQAVSVISFAFVCHHNTLLIYNSLKTPTLSRFAKVVHWSTGVSMVACTILGLGGFLSFKDKTMGNILNNFPDDDIMANAARFCFGFNMITTLPLEIFVCREVVLEFLWPHTERYSTLQHASTATILIFSAMVIALTTCDLGIILELVGATSACSIAYILPAASFLKLSSKKNTHPQKLMCWSCMIFGILVMVLSTTMTLLNVGKGEHKQCST